VKGGKVSGEVIRGNLKGRGPSGGARFKDAAACKFSGKKKRKIQERRLEKRKEGNERTKCSGKVERKNLLSGSEEASRKYILPI